MNVCLCSAFRDSSGYIDRYFGQIAALHNALTQRGDRMRLVVGEGDSSDCTRELVEGQLAQADYLTTFLDVSHGGPTYGSVVSAQRFKQLAQTWNPIWAAIPANYSAVLFVEADLIWDTETMLALLDCLDSYPAIAPKVLVPRIARSFWYDVWAFRKDGRHFRHAPPYFDDDDDVPPETPVQIESAGSVLAIRGALARKLSWPKEDVIVGVCRQIYEHGGSVWLHPALEVYHP